MLRDSAQYDQWRAALGDLRRSIANFQSSPLLASDAGYEQLNRSVATLIERVDEVNASPMFSSSEMYDNLTGAAQEMRQTLHDFQANPHKYTCGSKYFELVGHALDGAEKVSWQAPGTLQNVIFGLCAGFWIDPRRGIPVPKACFQAFRTHVSPDLCGLNFVRPQAHQVVSRQRKREHPLHQFRSPVPYLTQVRHVLYPPEYLFNTLPLLQTNLVSSMSRRSSIDESRAPSVLRHMRRHVHRPQSSHELLCVVSRIRSHRARSAVANSPQHLHSRFPFALCCRLSRARGYRQAAAILHQHMHHVTQLRCPRQALLVQHRVGIRLAFV